MSTAPATDLKQQRIAAFVRIKEIEHDIDTGMSHWYDEYRKMSLSALREEAQRLGYASSMKRSDLVDGLVSYRVAQRQQEIAALHATIQSLNERIG